MSGAVRLRNPRETPGRSPHCDWRPQGAVVRPPTDTTLVKPRRTISKEAGWRNCGGAPDALGSSRTRRAHRRHARRDGRDRRGGGGRRAGRAVSDRPRAHPSAPSPPADSVATADVSVAPGEHLLVSRARRCPRSSTSVRGTPDPLCVPWTRPATDVPGEPSMRVRNTAFAASWSDASIGRLDFAGSRRYKRMVCGSA
jgi:hypothetical protein